MIKSMTGYGRAEKTLHGGRRVAVDIKSLNNRYFEVHLKTPLEFAPYEHEIKKLVSAKISRGKIELFLRIDKNSNENTETPLELNLLLAKNYYDMLLKLKEALQLKEDIKLSNIIALKNIFTATDEAIITEECLPEIYLTVETAISSLMEMKLAEGANLLVDMNDRIDILTKTVDTISQRTNEVVDEYRQRLTRRIKELCASVNIDETRIAQEVAIMAEKSDIAEEITRFRSHLLLFRELLENKANEAVGKKIDFLIQEMGREVNTIGSKSSDVTITNDVIELKSELSKIREQVQNIE